MATLASPPQAVFPGLTLRNVDWATYCKLRDDPANPTTYRRGDVAEADPAVPGWRIAVDEIFA